MRKFIFILFSIFFIGCATTNVQPKEKINPENLRLEAAIKSHPGYDILVQRGFDIHSLDNVSNALQLAAKLSPYWFDENGYPLDNHFYIKDNYGKDVPFYNEHDDKRKSCPYIKEYERGTKEELLAKGYIENVTMFHSPTNYEKDWVAGYFSDDPGIPNAQNSNKQNSKNKNDYRIIGPIMPSADRIKGGVTKDSYEYYEAEKFAYIRIYEHPCNANSYSDFLKIAKKKDVIIINLCGASGGYPSDGATFVKGIKSLKNKKIYVLIDCLTASCDELVAANLSLLLNAKLIGCQTNGMTNYSIDIEHPYKFSELGISEMAHCVSGWCNVDPEFHKRVKHLLKEGVGLYPDYWCNTFSFVERSDILINDGIHKVRVVEKFSIDYSNIIKIINYDMGYEYFPLSSSEHYISTKTTEMLF